jgi:hypothetical protein
MMTTAAGKQLLRMGRVMSLFASGLWLAGCAGAPGVFGAGETAPPFLERNMSMQSASDAIVTGKSTKADVLAALGPATVVTFDSGFEVWVYRAKSREPAAAKAELVLLFAPTGIVKKTRLRPSDGVPGE